MKNEKPKYLDRDEFVRVRSIAILLLLLDSAIRLNELITLRVYDINLALRTAVVNGKGDIDRTVAFSDATADALRNYLSLRPTVNCDRLFLNTTTYGPMTQGAVHSSLRRLGVKAQVSGRVNPHAFRHGSAREYIRNGGDISNLSKQMGHSSTQITSSQYAVFEAEELAAMHNAVSPLKNLLEKKHKLG